MRNPSLHDTASASRELGLSDAGFAIESIRMETRTVNQLLEFVKKYLVEDGVKCYKHCEQPTKLVPIFQSETSLVGAYVCPQRHVSRVVYFADNPDTDWFEKFLREQVGAGRVRARDIRRATRFGWELGREAEKEISQVSRSGKVTQHYWTFYARTDKERQSSTWLCPREEGGCGKIYTEANSNDSILCENCGSS